MIAKSCSMGLEGIVSKLANSPYRPGRQESWIKAKCLKRQEFVIIGYTAARQGSRAIGALHLGSNDKGRMKYAGKVGTGFSMRDAQDLYDRLAKLTTCAPAIENLPRSILKTAYWVKAALLCEVAFTEWTADGHIRHPSFQGLREDEQPGDVTMEKPKSSVTKLKTKTESSNLASKTVAPKKSSNGAPKVPLPNGKIEVLGVTISHPDRLIFKDPPVTKGELAEFYAAALQWS
jgi:bifunctional non-homologous end joining protein LigD